MDSPMLSGSREPFVNHYCIKAKSRRRTTGADQKGQAVTQLLCQEKYLHKGKNEREIKMTEGTSEREKIEGKK